MSDYPCLCLMTEDKKGYLSNKTNLQKNGILIDLGKIQILVFMIKGL